ncbi:hypothetical protein RIF29_19696 [Crotalaria pallida]|uniref:Uncharacterized protein n=1 Tax=Crotalaria pallida TaxID=3830 RepID=A0AAN9EZV8_CROPI
MLVRRPPRRINNGFHIKKEDSATNYHGSRFMALNEPTEGVSVDLPNTIENSDSILEDKRKVDTHGPANKKIVRAKNSMAGKNPQQKPKHSTKGPINNQKNKTDVPKHKSIDPPSIPSTVKNDASSSVQSNGSSLAHNDDSHSHRNKNDAVILHRMRLLQKQGHTGLDTITTQVSLPSTEEIEFAQLHRGRISVINPKSIPPDPASNAKGSNGMEVDTPSPPSPKRDVPRNDLHSDNLDLEGQINNMCQ